METQNWIEIRGARENNLKNVTLRIPKYKLVVLTGPSGSGKSTLALDTLQRECQRQYMESLGLTAEALPKPKVDAIVGLSPSISIGQHVTNRNPRSTVGTVTDIHTYLRVIYEKLGETACGACGCRFRPGPAGTESGEGASDEADSPLQARCPSCGFVQERFTRRHFSYNTPEGACEACDGLGVIVDLDLEAVFLPDRSIRAGGVAIWYETLANYHIAVLKAAASHYGLPLDVDAPIGVLDEPARDLLYYGVESEAFGRHFPGVKPPKSVNAGKFEGVVTGIWRRYKEKGGESSESGLFRERTCEACGGARLKEAVRQVTAGGVSIAELSGLALEEAVLWLERLQADLPADDLEGVGTLLHDLTQRTRRIVDVGLGYLTLNRQTVSLSGGEAQRLRLASILGSGLTGVLYILDEPTAGLHPRDTAGLIRVLRQLRDLGNTVLVIEHDVEVMRAADHVIDMGPGAGRFGGQVVGEGTLPELMAQETSVTGAYLLEQESGGRRFFGRRTGTGEWLTIRDAHLRNLKHLDVSIPLGRLVAVTGVSGSGKSTLLFELLAEGAAHGGRVGGCAGIEGLSSVGGLVTVDQSPLGRMSRSNVATYTGVFAAMRNLYAGLPEARRAGLTAKHFSFNTPGGRCEHCEGLGVVPMDMFFLPGLEVRCPVCKGKRFKEEVLRVTYEGRTISDLLDLTVQESLALLKGRSGMEASIGLLNDVGLGYLHWGQSVRTLSGGEAQRIRLAKELGGKPRTHTLYLLDEPSTGLHPRDTERLLLLLGRLVDAGHSVLVVEHNLDVIRACDWVIDIGPEGGAAGGELMAAGTPEEVAADGRSHTGRYLRAVLQEAGAASPD